MRRILVLLMVVLLPLQGMAAVMAGQCMALGHHEAPADHADGHSHDGHDGHEGHEGHDAAAPADAKSAGGHCGPCVACCASAAIDGFAALSVDASPSAAPYAFSQSPPPGVQPDGLDRPPLPL